MTTFVLYSLGSIGGYMPRNRDQNKVWKEIVEIGAYKVGHINGRLDIISDFHTFICPFAHRLEPYRTSLTYIQDSDLEQAPKFQDAIEEFIRWAGTDSVFVSWDNSFWETLVDNNQRNWILDFPRLKTMNLRDEYTRWTHTAFPVSLKQAVLEVTGKRPDPGHSVMIDAFDMATILLRLYGNPSIYQEPRRTEAKIIDGDYEETRVYRHVKSPEQRPKNKFHLKEGDALRQLREESRQRNSGRLAGVY